MPSNSDFVLRIAKATASSEQGKEKMAIIIRQPYGHLEKELLKSFKDQEDVEVIVDRRQGDRRTKQEPIAMDRRRVDRRSPKEELVDIILST